MRKSKDSKQNKEILNQSLNFYKGLKERFMSLKSNQSVKQSRTRQISKSIKTNKGLKDSQREQKQKLVKSILDVSQLPSQQSLTFTMENYNFDAIMNQPQKLSEMVNLALTIDRPKFISIKVDSLSPQNQHNTKIQTVAPYVQSIIKQFQKAIICIYSIGNSTQNRQFYDMLSIRRQIKTDSKLLVQTNICNNSKSGIILKKLIDVAKQRQKIMTQEQLIKTVVIKLKGTFIADKENHQNGQSKQIQLQLCSGAFGQVQFKDLMGAQKMRMTFKIIQCPYSMSPTEIQQIIMKYKKKIKQNQNQLIEKIKNLQAQLQQKKKELQSQKLRVAREEAIQAELEDIVLPSERPMINIQKYDTRKVAASRKSSLRNGKCI